MSEHLLPLFPLQVVLFPNSLLHRHIFEDRYKLLINECVTEKKDFGINLVQDGKIADVGCTAAVTTVVRRHEDGRMDIVVQGRQRYILKALDTERAPYFVGRVVMLTPSEEKVDRELAIATIELFNDLVSAVYKGKGYELLLELPSQSVSFVVAQKAGLDLTQRQQLLEMRTENDRLESLRNYLDEVIPKLKTMEEIERIIKSDGYL